MADIGPDGKIRIRCTNCNKKLKFPAAAAGQIFNCPMCGAKIVTPLADAVVAARVEAQALKANKAPESVVMRDWEAKRLQNQKNMAIDNLTRFLGRECVRVGEACDAVILNEPEDIDPTELGAKFAAIERDRATRLAQYVGQLRSEIGERIQKLRRHPMLQQGAIQLDLKRSLKEQRDFEAFVRVMLRAELPGAEPEQAPSA